MGCLMAEDKQECIEVPIGNPGQDFQTGNFLNAIDHVNQYFQEKCHSFSDAEAAGALRLMADNIEGKFE